MPEIKIHTNVRTVAAAGTPEQLATGTEETDRLVKAVTIRAHATNTNNIYVTNVDHRATAATTGYILAAGETLTLDVSDKPETYIDLGHVWIDAAVNGEGVSLCWVPL